MPGGDRTGPAGQGPMTGRRAGFCVGYPMPGYANPMPGRSRGRGFGRGWGKGQGRGRGFGWAYGLQAYPGAYGYPYVPELTAKEEADMLKEQAKVMQDEIKAMQAHIKELESLAKTEKDK